MVRDIEAALAHWSGVAGVGPWFYVERAPIHHFEYRGQPHEIHLSIALANSGPLQLELIEQRNDVPSLYREFLDAGQEGLQHIAYWTRLRRRPGARPPGRLHGRTRGEDRRLRPVRLLRLRRHPGSVIELSDVGGRKRRLFEHIRAAADTWDGRDPVRAFPTDIA